MKCQRCNKNEANTHITKVINGVKTELYLCPQCAAESGELAEFGSGFDKDFDNFFSGFFGNTQLGETTARQEQASNICSLCGTTLNEVLKRGKLGCSECYNAFAAHLERPFRQIHGNVRHTGKIPSRCGGEIKLRTQIESLQKELNGAVMEQNFEKAAELRDKIKELKSQNEQRG